jgi:hypothetical protein
VSINTWSRSPDVTKEDAQVQLLIWISTYFQHLRTLAKPNSLVSITLPLVSVTEEKWELLFAHDCGNGTEVVYAVEMGDTTSMLGCYQILKLMRVLAAWTDGQFRDWVQKEMLNA